MHDPELADAASDGTQESPAEATDPVAETTFTESTEAVAAAELQLEFGEAAAPEPATNAEPTPEPTESEPAPAAEAEAEAEAESVPQAEPVVDEPVVDEPEPEVEELTGFAALDLRPELLAAVLALGYETPTPIQRETIPHLLAGADVLGQAATGTGKTAAFALPIINKIHPDSQPVPRALVLVPTRELAVQVHDAIVEYGKGQRVKALAVYGGQPIQHQLKDLKRGVHVVVATPGRAIDHIKRGSLQLGDIETVVLDEADEMLDMGFTEDIETILDGTPDDRQTVLFSATMPPRIHGIAKKYQRDPIRIRISNDDQAAARALVRQTAYFVQRHHKPAALGRILDIESPQSALVFCKTRSDVDQLTATMNSRGYRAEALHGGMDQNQRDRVMSRLRDGTAELLVATDVAARGLDIDSLTHVVNYDVPAAAESYVHRIGRVGRAGREGVAITLAEPRNRRALENIERLTKQKIAIQKVPSVSDLKARQIELTVAAVTEALASPDLDDYYSVLNALSGVDSDRNIALAAIKLVHQSRNATLDDVEIPDVADKAGQDRFGTSGKKFDKKDKDKKSYQKDGDRGRKGQPADGDAASIYINVGRKAGIRPGDLVGAIANETDLIGRQIGPIRISDMYSIVGIPDSSVDRVIKAIANTTIKGKKAKARRYVQ
ncbi:MAG: ATP-dependent RNA helicase DeaD [Candidatus Poriferisodalaceae bacterium]|jgi:ATP-dependent RNA helicase DeaD